MNKTALIALGVFAALLAVVFYLERGAGEGDVQSYEIGGFAASEANVAKSTTELEAKDFDKIEIRRKGESMTFQQEGGKWRIVAPQEGRVDQNKLKSILLPHQRTLKSIFSTAFKAETAGDYGLDESQAIAVTIYRNGAVFAAYEVGESAKSDDPEARADEVDSWIRPPGGETVFRMGGVDLRAAVDHSMSDFRDKKLFDFERLQMARVEIENPANTEHRVIALVNTTPPPAKKEGEAEGKADEKEPTPAESDKWIIESPTGFRAGTGATSFLSSLAGVRVTDYLATTEGLDTGLEGPEAVHIRVSLHDGTSTELVLGKVDGEQAYGKLGGSNEVFTLSKYTAQSLQKTINDLRDKKVLELSRDAITGFRFPAADLIRQGDTWIVSRPAGLVTSQTIAQGLLADVENWSITEFEPAKEDLSPFGLGPLDLTENIVIVHTGGELSLTFSAEKDGSFWVKAAGNPRGEIWKVSSYMGKKFAGKTANDFRKREVFGVKKDDIAKVELLHADGTVVVERKAAPPAADGGSAEEAKESWVVSQGEQKNESPKENVVSTLVSTVATLSAKDFAFEKTPADTGLDGASVFRARVTMKDGSVHELRISDKKGAEDAPYASAPSEPDWGAGAFTLNPYQASNIQKKMSDFN